MKLGRKVVGHIGRLGRKLVKGAAVGVAEVLRLKQYSFHEAVVVTLRRQGDADLDKP